MSNPARPVARPPVPTGWLGVVRGAEAASYEHCGVQARRWDAFAQPARTVFILPAGTFGCLGCARAMACAQTPQVEPTGHSWTEKADVTWEEMFRFAYQKDLIPLLKELGATRA